MTETMEEKAREVELGTKAGETRSKLVISNLKMMKTVHY